MQSVSYYDTAKENFYHGFMLGLCSLLSGSYVTSNRESGDGRFDIQLMPLHEKLPGILIELKAENKAEAVDLNKTAQRAVEQINANRYDTEMLSKGVSTIYRYGVAFSGKRVEVAVG